MGTEETQPSTNPGDTKQEITAVEESKPLTKAEYITALQSWMQQARIAQSAMACFPYYMMSAYPQIFQPPLNPAATSTTAQPQTAGQNPVAENDTLFAGFPFRANRFGGAEPNIAEAAIIDQNGGYEYVIAPLWKRMAAEAVDAIILFIIKLVITFALVDFFDINVQNYLRTFDFDFDNLKSTLEDDYIEFVTLTSELLAIEMLAKVAVCFYEAVWTYKSLNRFGCIGGATPGKFIFGIRILHVTAVYPLQEQQQAVYFNRQPELRALLFPARDPGFIRALVRAFTKNVIMTVLFPMFCFLFFFKNNRTGYDLLTKTIVVEQNPAPILRRRPLRPNNNNNNNNN